MTRLAASAAFFLIIATTTATASRARAQSNRRLPPIGGRTTILGGTGVVYGQDAAAAFINPATAVLADDRRLSFSANFYSLTFMSAPRWYQPGEVDRQRFGNVDLSSATMSDMEFNALPSSLCIFFRVSGVLGVCLAAVQSESWNFAAEGFSGSSGDVVTRQAQSLSQSYTRYAGGPTYALQVTDALAVGASLHFSFASHRSLLTSTATTHRGGASPINSVFYTASRGDSFQLTGIVGATYALGRQKVGLAIEPPSLHVYGRGGANRHANFDGEGGSTTILTADGSFSSQSPLRVSLGSGFERDWGLFEVNATYSHSVRSAYHAELEGDAVDVRNGVVDDRAVSLDLSERARGVMNFGAGLEVFLNPKISVLGGASTDLSALGEGDLRGSIFNYYPQRTTRLAASAGVASHGSGGDLVLGTEFSVGWGERLAPNAYRLPPDLAPTEHRTYQVLLTVAGATTLRTLRRAVEDVKEVVVPKRRSDDR